MRSADQNQEEMFYMLSWEELVPLEHPLRHIRKLTDEALQRMQPHLAGLYAERGRPGIAPERLLRALVLQVLYGYRSERRLMEEMRFNFALRWFVGLSLADKPWDVTVFTKNRQRFLKGDVAAQWVLAVLAQAQQAGLIDEEHFSVDGTLIQAWAGEKSYVAKPEPPDQGSGRRGKVLKRDRFVSRTDPDAHMYRKSCREAFRLSYLGHVVMENKHGLIAASTLTRAATFAERQAAVGLLDYLGRIARQLGWRKPQTVAADTAYHEQDFVSALQNMDVQGHLPAWPNRKRPDLIGATIRNTSAYEESRRKRKWIERCFAWLKQQGRQRQTRFRGTDRVCWSFTFATGVYNLVRMRKLLPAT